MRFTNPLAALLLLTASAHAEDDDRARSGPRAQLADQVIAELQTLEATMTIVRDKLSVADKQRSRRLRAAYRILRAPLTIEASASDRMAAARRRAAARLLLERDHTERSLLAAETEQLRAARITKIEANAKLPTIELPEEIGRPARGDIARRFGTLVHERSKATLSRRGIDFEVERDSPAWAPADGVVRYAGRIRGLDHGVILDHGDYYTVIAKLAELAIPVGTRVSRGDRLGRAARHRVYLEVRVKVTPGGLPIDPEPLLAD